MALANQYSLSSSRQFNLTIYPREYFANSLSFMITDSESSTFVIDFVFRSTVYTCFPASHIRYRHSTPAVEYFSRHALTSKHLEKKLLRCRQVVPTM